MYVRKNIIEITRKNIKDISKEKGGKSRPANEKYYEKHQGNDINRNIQDNYKENLKENVKET